MKKMKFPITAKGLTEKQEKQLGRPLNAAELEVAEIAVASVNEAFEDGKAGIETALYPMDPEKVWNSFYSKTFGKDLRVRQFIIALLRMQSMAWAAGWQQSQVSA